MYRRRFVSGILGLPVALLGQSTLDSNEFRPRGDYYNATVPETLDIAEWSKLSLSGLLAATTNTEMCDSGLCLHNPLGEAILLGEAHEWPR